MKKPLLLAIFLISFAVIILGTSCKKAKVDNTAPSLSTTDVILDVTSTTAQSGGTVSSEGSAAITANGVCYSSTNHIPTLADSVTKEAIIYYSYTYISNLKNLLPNTTYYVRAYASNQYGTGYGKVVKFTTSSTLVTVTGAVTTLAGSATGGTADGMGTAAQFNNPTGIAVDASGNIYVSDSFNNSIRKITADGTVTTLAGNGTAGYADGPAASAQFYAPQGLTVDAQGNVFVADYGNNVIREISTAGVVSTYAGNTVSGYVDGAALNKAEFSAPAGVAFDKSGNLYVADSHNNMIRKITSAGVVSTVAGTKTAGYVDVIIDAATGKYASFNNPKGLVVDAAGNIYIADTGNSAIREISGITVTTIGGGPTQTALFGYPSGVCLDAQGNFFVSDEAGRVVELTASKILYSLAGASGVNGFVDGAGTAAQFSTPEGIAVDASGNIYVTDFNNNAIRKVIVTDINN